MTEPKYRVTWKTFLLLLVGLIAFFVFLYLFNVDIQEIAGTVQTINLNFYLLAAILAVLDTLFFTFAWHALLGFLSVKTSLFKSFLYVWVAIFVDTIVPAESVSGELAKIYLVNREQDGAAGKATASIVVQRLIGMGIIIVTLTSGAILLLIENLLYGVILALILFLIAMTFIFLALMLLLCTKSSWTLRIVSAIIGFAERISRGRFRLTRLREEVIEATKAFHSAMKEYAHAPRTLFTAASLSITSWMLALAVFYLTFLAVGYSQISWSTVMVVSSIFVAVKSIPVGIPFEVGLPEITLTTLLVLFGVPPGISATVTILSRLLTLWLKFFIGFVAQQWIGIRTIAPEMDAKLRAEAVDGGRQFSSD